MKKRGRIQEGCFADLVLFDTNTIQDHATYEKGFVKSTGVEYLLVNGQVLISEGKLQENVFPGKAIKGQLNYETRLIVMLNFACPLEQGFQNLVKSKGNRK